MFYTFIQNNTGGTFTHDASRGIGINVIVEARDAEHANERAQEVGLYFNGCETRGDCRCCGDRWSEAYGKGDEMPEIFGSDAFAYVSDWCNGMYRRDGADVYGFIHYMDGTVKPLGAIPS